MHKGLEALELTVTKVRKAKQADELDLLTSTLTPQTHAEL